MGFNDFIGERRYLNNVSPATISWYTHAFKWLPCESPTQEQLKDTVMSMREKGLKATAGMLQSAPSMRICTGAVVRENGSAVQGGGPKILTASLEKSAATTKFTQTIIFPNWKFWRRKNVPVHNCEVSCIHTND